MKTIIKVESVNKTYEIPYEHTYFPSFKDAICTAKKFINDNMNFNILGIKSISCTICSEKKGNLIPKYMVYNSGEEVKVEEL